MKRKVSLHGPSTLTVSLPANWVKKYGIKKGDELEVEENSVGLLVSTGKNMAFSKKEIDISHLSPLIRRCIKKLYQEGYDELDVVYGEAKYIEEVQEFIPQLIGYEIVEHGDSRCVIKDVTNIGDGQFDKLLRRMFLLLKGIFSDTCTGLEKNDGVMLRNAKLRDREVNRLANYCIRDLFKHGQTDNRKMTNFLKVYQCEQVGDEYKNMILTIAEEKVKVSRDFLKYHQEVEKFFDLIYHFTFDATVKRAIEVERQHKRLKKTLEKKLLKSKSKELESLFFLRSLVNMMMVLHEIELGHLKDL
ncbi:MAG: phosphate uptake regulator PhoU [Nanoarchaeota archaeon]|nr:phosphate uptake regulator PhoU [Nanoarchaeota archaeon]